MLESWILPSVKPTSYWCLEGTNHLMDRSKGSYESCHHSSDRCILNYLRVQLMRNLHLKYGDSALNTEMQGVKGHPLIQQKCALEQSAGLWGGCLLPWWVKGTDTCGLVPVSAVSQADHTTLHGTSGHMLPSNSSGNAESLGAAITATDCAAEETTTGYPPAVFRPFTSWKLPLATDGHHSFISVSAVSPGNSLKPRVW